ncbi:MAG: hypothetical protein CMH32_07645 [Micavibrio sp.]|jgi:hypothetical protein|nr:hypothetical protein [Micavibrio sp.]HCK33119.1 hypothetical protein [Rhodospirillaceae bacterium]
MLYVQQSLSPDEKIVHIGRFHWAYRAAAVSWIMFGAVVAYFIIHVAVHIEVTSIIDQRFPSLPEHLQGEAWDRVVKAKGGLIKTILGLHIGVRIAAFLSILVGVFMFARMMIIMYVTEICVTNQRMIYKTGLISRYVGEISVNRIEGVNVLQSIMGRLLGYGTIIVRGMGVGEVRLPPIADPITFRRAIEKARSL